ncbi:MAG: helix-turn-helix domain-containing protein [Sulfurovum sp.]|nr:helix-turn-helix domain-containing protein [Sulfurovum sp.]
MQNLLNKKKDAARLLQISESTLDRLRKSGQIKSKKVGGQVMFMTSEILRFLED